jgi:hypothetical protein
VESSQIAQSLLLGCHGTSLVGLVGFGAVTERAMATRDPTPTKMQVIIPSCSHSSEASYLRAGSESLTLLMTIGKPLFNPAEAVCSRVRSVFSRSRLSTPGNSPPPLTTAFCLCISTVLLVIDYLCLIAISACIAANNSPI